MVHVAGENKGQSRGFGFVKFHKAEDGVCAMQELNAKKIGQKRLKIELKKDGG
jgi:RNA recognition motif-containing protein